MRTFIVIFAALFPVLVQAEVMDKEPSFFVILILALFGALLAFLTARFKPWLLLVLLPVVGALTYLQLSELIDPVVGPAIAAEAGRLYVIISWAAPVLVFAGYSAGFIWRRRNVKVNT